MNNVTQTEVQLCSAWRGMKSLYEVANITFKVFATQDGQKDGRPAGRSAEHNWLHRSLFIQTDQNGSSWLLKELLI